MKAIVPSKKFEDLQEFYDLVMQKGYEHTDACPDDFYDFETSLENLKAELSMRSRTAKLWIQYLYYVATLKMLIRAERTANWELHLLSIYRMINLFAATGHYNYAKSARLYVEMMSELPNTHPDVYEYLINGGHVARRSNRGWAGISVDLTIEQTLMRELKSKGGLTHGRGISEGTRTTWVASVHKTAAIKAAIADFTELGYHHDTEQHPELGKARLRRDHDDIIKILQFLDHHNPFSSMDASLHSLISGISAGPSDNVNCDEAETIGENIIRKMDGMKMKDIKMKRSLQIKTLAHVNNTVNTACKKRLDIDPAVLFHRLLVIAQRSPNIEPYFAFELSAQPSSLFKGNYMRKTDKSLLTKEICKGIPYVSKPKCSVYIVDGGFLLHVVKWAGESSYANVADQYVTFLAKFLGGSVMVIFDGYDYPSIKDHEHKRRASIQAPDIIVEAHKMAYKDQGTFLANTKNKKAFVKFLIAHLKANNFVVQQAIDDADTLIVHEAIQQAAENVVGVIANDTDIFIMLLYHFKTNMCDIFLYSHEQKINSIRMVVTTLKPEVLNYLLVIHALTGCDTTSSFFGHGKASVYKKLTKLPDIKPLIEILESSSADHDEVMQAGCALIALLYGGNIKDSLNHLRYSTYMHIIATGTQLLKPEKLPPTESTARYHVYRVHLQVLCWKLLTTAIPEEWGWKMFDGNYIPITNDAGIAPDDILKVVCCKCSSDVMNPCGSKACMCRKFGLPCVAACKNCNGTSCENKQCFSEQVVHLDEANVTNIHDKYEDSQATSANLETLDFLELYEEEVLTYID